MLPHFLLHFQLNVHHFFVLIILCSCSQASVPTSYLPLKTNVRSRYVPPTHRSIRAGLTRVGSCQVLLIAVGAPALEPTAPGTQPCPAPTCIPLPQYCTCSLPDEQPAG
ncbi:hypothetical protein CB1_000159025 [Camelus ferus]|nr:hypothetical protein CB1_000159025 [Camelus ferus]